MPDHNFFCPCVISSHFFNGEGMNENGQPPMAELLKCASCIYVKQLLASNYALDLVAIVTGKSVTAVLNFVNTTPTEWFSKRQLTATYGSQFVAAKTATEQIMDLRNTLRLLGVTIMTKAYMFGNNKSVVTTVMTGN